MQETLNKELKEVQETLNKIVTHFDNREW
jgi:hypothetical protein